MATTPLGGDNVTLPQTGGVWSVRRAEVPRGGRAEAPPPPLDVLDALAELGDSAPQADGGIAEAMLAWLMPRPRHADTLTQARMAPLLGVAAEMIAHSTQMSPDIAKLGAMALEQELRMQRAVAERRAALTLGAME